MSTLDERLDAVETSLGRIERGVGELADADTIKTPLINIDDRLAQIDDRLQDLRGRVAESEKDVSTVAEAVSSMQSQLDEMEAGEGGGGSRSGNTSADEPAEFAGTATSDASTSGFMTGGSDDENDLDDVEDKFDFDEEFLGIDDEDDTA